MSTTTIPRRSDVLRRVVDEAARRRDGALPLELPGVAETFHDDLDLVSALQVRWYTRLAGQIELALLDDPMDLESAVLAAWRRAASELVGVREILDAYAARPTSDAMRTALQRARRKEWVLLAAMAGQTSASDAGAVRVGRRLEDKARSAYDPARVPHQQVTRHRARLLDRLKAHRHS